MPNWASGSIRFRGKAEDIRKFLENEIIVEHRKEEGGLAISTPRVDINLVTMTAEVTPQDGKERGLGLYINGSNRNFLILWTNSAYADYVCEVADDEIIVGFESFTAAWGVEAEFYVELAKKYNIDIRIVTWECGMCVEDSITISRNATLIRHCETMDSDDWFWMAVHPGFGG